MRGAAILRRCFGALVVVAVAYSLFVAPAPASAAVTPTADPGWGTVTGIVKDTYGVPITGSFDSDYVIMVQVWQYDEGWYQIYADEYGNDFQVDYNDGTFAFDLPEGTYKLRFYDWFNQYSASGYREEFYPSSYTVAGAGNVVVTDGGTTTANMTLDLWEHGSAAGLITDATDGSKVWGVQAMAYADDGFGNWNWDATWGSTSLSMGDWSVTQVPVGQYKLEFSDWEYYRYRSQWYGGGADIDSAPWVTIAPMHTVANLNASMVRYGHIKGRVTGPGGVPIEGVYGQVFMSSGGGWTEIAEGSHQKPTDANGYYDYAGLPAGTYRVVFWDPDGEYIQEVYNNISAPAMNPYEAAALGGATNIVLASGEVRTGIDAQLALGARIIGNVQDSFGPVPWTDVTIIDSATGTKKGMTQTDENGDYSLGNVLAGTYKVRFDFAGPEYHEGYYPSDTGDLGWYYGRRFYSSATTTASATVLTLSTGTYGTPVNTTLAATSNWGRIGVRVTGPYGSELSAIPVAVDYWDSDGGSWTEYHTGSTRYTGRVEFPYIPMGTLIRIRANDSSAWDWNDRWGTYSTQYTVASTSWTGAFYLNPATEDMSGNPLGTMWGKARDEVTSGNIAAVPVTTYLYDSGAGEWWWDHQMIADSAGWFEIPSQAGAYKVEAGPTMLYASEFYNNASTITAATTVNVTAYSYTSLVQIGLNYAHTISGTIRDGSGAGIGGVYVSALRYNADWDVWEPVTYDGATNAFTAANGTYTLGGLPNGTYKLMAYGWENNLGSKGWKASGEAQSVDQADAITLSGAATGHGGYDMTLTPAVMLRGSVTDGDSKRVTGVHVKLWWDDPAGDWALINSTYTYNDGDFEFAQFSAGEYFLEFIDDTNYLYEDSWYKNVPMSATAVSVPLAHGESKVITQTVVSVSTNYLPVYGLTRLDTAVSASELAFPDGAKTVVIATAFNWPDALGGAALAGAYDGPILLTSPTDLPRQVQSEIDRLGATDAIILGSSAAVSTAVEDTLKRGLGTAHVRRLQGRNRYETAVAVAEATIDRLGDAYDGTAFVATGENFPDALGASPLAAAANWPIYLTAADSLTPASLSSMKAQGVTNALILGSTRAVSSGVQTSLNTALGGSSHTTRLQGTNRYETAAVIAQYGVDHVYGLGWNGVAIATGENYPDALAGGVLQGQSGSVMLLTPTSTLHAAVAAKLAAEKDTITEVRYLGSTNAVAPAVRTAVQQILK